jgi:aspartyl-tRNA(Asn)/glutamyl-tRNA(Gln) amidotransferase subunit A
VPELPDATALLEDLRSGALSPLEALDAALERIARIDPAVNAFRLVDADRAREAAARSQARWSRG